MSEKLENSKTFESIARVWKDMFMALWGPATEMWQKANQQQDPSKQEEAPGRVQAFWASTLKSWQALFAAAGEPVALVALMKVVPLVSEILLKFSQTGLQGFIDLQEEFNNRLEKMNASSDPFNFEEIDREFLSRMREMYEKESR